MDEPRHLRLARRCRNRTSAGAIADSGVDLAGVVFGFNSYPILLLTLRLCVRGGSEDVRSLSPIGVDPTLLRFSKKSVGKNPRPIIQGGLYYYYFALQV